MNNTKGFSLVELLVVVAIIGILLSVVAPNAFNLKQRFEIQREQKLLVQFVQEQSYNSYFQSTEQTLHFVGNQIQASMGTSIEFTYLTFVDVTLQLDSYGQFPTTNLQFYANTNPMQVELTSP